MMNHEDHFFYHFTLNKDYQTLAKHNIFITGSNVFHLHNIKLSDKMN